ncbi:MAG TPA: glycogen/starch synthase [Treponemataceae bacterium]|nr:glycogen/starch synthase [Treponemataceae bacterium]
MPSLNKTTVRNMNIWQISREYAGIAEAGGVKNVCTSLAEGLVDIGANVTHFIPFYGCTNLNAVKEFKTISNISWSFTFNNKKHSVNFARAYSGTVTIIFVINSLFTQKNGVYTYTALDEALKPEHKQGEGHKDASLLNMIFQTSILNYSIQTGQYPDIIHCQDAATALIPFLAHKKNKYKQITKKASFIITIHNAGRGYHHTFSLIDGINFTGLAENNFTHAILNGRVEPLLLSTQYALYTTVSPWYAKELVNPKNKNSGGLSAEFAKRKVSIKGITNGIDYEKYNPSDINKSLLPFPYNPEKGDFSGKRLALQKFINYYKSPHNSTVYLPTNPDQICQYGTINHTKNCVYFSFHGRLVEQKGIDVLVGAAKITLEKTSNIRFLIIGQGSTDLEKKCIQLAKQFAGRFLYLKGYDRSIARQCVAVADFLLLPSYFEPCCLEDFIGQLFGTIPIAHAAGGLQKIIHGKTGYVYKKNTADNLATIILKLSTKKIRNPKKFLKLAKKGALHTRKKYSWHRVIKDNYIPLYLNV